MAEEAQDRVLERALEAYGLAGAVVVPLRRGLIHLTFSLEHSGDAYILQRVSPSFSRGIHENIAAVTEHLVARGVTSPRLVRTPGGELFADLGEQGRWRLMTRLPGVAFDRCHSLEQVRAAGALLAEFHGALLDLDAELHPVGFPFHDMPLHLADLRRALAVHADHRHRAAVGELADAIFSAVERWDDIGDVPARVIHGDPKFNNLLFVGEAPGERERGVGLIDLDTLARLPLYVDLGDAWRSWCNGRREDESDAELDLSIFRASAEGYLGEFPVQLAREELASLAHGLERIALELSARFAADALEECYFGWDRDRFEAAGDHNLARARGQLALARQAEVTREERLRFLCG